MDAKQFLDSISKHASVNFKELVKRANDLGVTAIYVSEDAEEYPKARVSVSFILDLGEKDEGI